MAKDHGPSIKDDERYEALGKDGMSKEKAARIANTPSHEAGRKGGEAAPYEEWTADQLQERAAEIGIEGRSSMDKADLIEALREH
jgi:general stress protein YciG